MTGGHLIGFTALLIVGVLLAFTWIGLTATGSGGSVPEASDPNRVDAVIVALVAGLLVARIAFVSLHLPYYRDHPAEILAFWQGGLSASGAILGALLGLALFSTRNQLQYWRLLDNLAVPALILALTAWIGCWLDGVAYGRQVALEWAWLMDTDPFPGKVARWPTQMLGLTLTLIAFLALHNFSTKLHEGVLGTLSLATITLVLAVVGIFRADPVMTFLSLRLDVFAPAMLSVIGYGLGYYQWNKSIQSRK